MNPASPNVEGRRALPMTPKNARKDIKQEENKKRC
jgi:hypothetical protein